jgi:hypothetical protein
MSMTIDPIAVLEDLDARRRTLTDAERAQYRACMVVVCGLCPAAKAAYQKWSADLIDLRTGAAVVIAAAKAENSGQREDEGR